MAFILNDNGIKFSDITNTGAQTGNRRSNVKYTDTSGNQIGRPSTSETELSLPSPFVNAIDIDWNAADLGKEVQVNLDGTPSEGNSVKINTTGTLLSYISALAQRIDNIESVLLQLGQ